MTPYEAFVKDPRRERLSDRLIVFAEAMYRDLETIMNGNPNDPVTIWHMIDKARIAAGFMPQSIWDEEPLGSAQSAAWGYEEQP